MREFFGPYVPSSNCWLTPKPGSQVNPIALEATAWKYYIVYDVVLVTSPSCAVSPRALPNYLRHMLSGLIRLSLLLLGKDPRPKAECSKRSVRSLTAPATSLSTPMLRRLSNTIQTRWREEEPDWLYRVCCLALKSYDMIETIRRCRQPYEIERFRHVMRVLYLLNLPA